MKCEKELNPKNHLFKEFLIDHFKDDVEGNIEDSIFDLLTKWIISHLYGIGVFSAVVFTSVIIINKGIELNKYDTSYKKIDSPFEVASIKNICEEYELFNQELVCEDNYTLENEQCIKTDYMNPIEYITCDNNYTLIGNNCISNNSIEYNVSVSCPRTLAGSRADGWGTEANIMSTYESGGQCYIKYCNDSYGTTAGYAQTGICSGSVFDYVTSASPQYTYTCNGYELNGTCRTYGQKYYHSTCNEGELIDNRCVVKDIKTPSKECPSGTIYNSSCQACMKEDA